MEPFWKNWDRLSRNIYLFSLTLLMTTLIAVIYFAIKGHENLIHWITLDQFEDLKVAIDSFSSGVFTVPVEADAKIVFSLLTGTAPQIELVFVWSFFIVANISLILALTSFSFLNNWLFYVGSFVVLSSYVFQQPNILFYDNPYSKFALALPIIMIGGTGYYFFAFATKASFITRFSAIAIITSLYYAGLFYFSQSTFSVLFLSNYGSIAFMCIALGFVFLVSFEIVYLFLYIISNSKGTGSKSGTLQFVIVYLLYTVNLLAQYLKNRGVIEFDLLFINPFIILLISAIAGIWGFRERSGMFKNTLPFYPMGGVIYLSWAILTAASIGYCFYMGNDPLIEVFEDTILFTHIGFGFGYCLYVAWNYGEWINKQVQVHKIIYTYRWVTFLTVYAIGFIVFLCFFFYSIAFIYRQFQSGYHNFIGDVYYQSGDLALAERYYKDAEVWEFQNHKTNYSLATIYQRQNRFSEALSYYRRANLKQPSAFAYANLAVMKYLQGGELESILDAQGGIKEFPNNGALKINLGLFYERIHFPDSSFHYFKLGEKDPAMSAFALSNQKALFAKYGIDSKDAEQVIVLKNKTGQLITNELAHAFVLNKPIEKISLSDLITDTIIDQKKFAMINNYILKMKSETGDSGSISLIKKMIASDSNIVYRTDLLYLKAVADNYRDNPYEAAKAVDLLQLSNESYAGKYLNTLGLWTLEQKNGRFAASIFQMAYDKGFKDALLNKAIAEAESKDFYSMAKTLQSVDYESDTNVNKVAGQLISINKPLKFFEVLIADDATKATFLYYKGNTVSDSENQNLFYSIKDKSLRLTAGMALFDLYYQKDDKIVCGELLDELTKETYSNQQLSTLNLKVLQYLTMKNQIAELEKAVISNKLMKKELIYLPYYEAIIAESKDDLKLAEVKYIRAVTSCTFNEEIQIRASIFFSKKAKNQKLAFNTLLNAVAMNPYSVKLWKSYCLESVAYGLPRFGENGLESLKPLVTDSEYQSFKKTFEKAAEDYTKELLGL